VPTDDSTLERSPAGHLAAQAAIVDAQKHFGPGLMVMVLLRG
jgi:hypothetical protein